MLYTEYILNGILSKSFNKTFIIQLSENINQTVGLLNLRIEVCFFCHCLSLR